MKPNYQVYRDAAMAVSRSWAWKAWRNKDGGPCLVQAILDQIGEPLQGTLPMPMQLELDSQLVRLKSYCRGRKARKERKAALAKGEDIQKFAIRWNDARGRKQGEVVAVLNALADRLELAHLAHIRDLASRARTTVPWDEVGRSLEDIWDEQELAGDALVVAGSSG